MSNNEQKQVIGFIGTGVMGRSMAGHLIEAGYQLHVFNRSKEKTETLVERGAVWQESVAALAANAGIVITMVGFPQDVEAVYLGADGLIAHARSGSVLIDMTTSSPLLARRIAEEASQKDIGCLDAPVSGGDIGAREARLSIMVGGDKAVFDRMLPIFEILGKNIVLQGPAGSGQHTKMCNQIAVASGMVGVCEAMAYAKKSGLDPDTVLQSIASGAAASWALSNMAPRFLKGNFSPGFYVKHFIKDMSIGLEEGSAMGLEMPGLALTKQLYEEIAASGGENDGTQSLFKLYEVDGPNDN